MRDNNNYNIGISVWQSSIPNVKNIRYTEYGQWHQWHRCHVFFDSYVNGRQVFYCGLPRELVFSLSGCSDRKSPFLLMSDDHSKSSAWSAIGSALSQSRINSFSASYLGGTFLMGKWSSVYSLRCLNIKGIKTKPVVTALTDNVFFFDRLSLVVALSFYRRTLHLFLFS